MKYAQIRDRDISNGEGIRVSLFVQGCDFHCSGCFNESTWNWNGGKEFIPETINEILTLCEPSYIAGLSILGGEPLHPNNINEVENLARAFKDYYTNKDIWIWSGYTMESYIKDQNILKYTDYIIDGQFKEDEKNLRLKFRGSSNQRIWHKGDLGWYVLEGEKVIEI